MNTATLGLAVLLTLAASPRTAQTPVRIGFVGALSGSTAVLGNDISDSFELALDHLGRKMGGLPAEVF
jgi:branched-chain amino acid transport system substrate-binding protein